MSLSNPRVKNPAVHFIEWSGSKGKFYYYDKELPNVKGDKGGNVYFDTPLYIVPLDELATIVGFNEKANTGIYSNEVKLTGSQVLTVKTHKGDVLGKGLYADIKDAIKNQGAKYAKSIYAVLITPGAKGEKPELKVVNIRFYGSSMKWIEAKVDVDSGRVVELLPNTKQKSKKGANEYFEPFINVKNKRQDILDDCVELDKALQAYLAEYFSSPEKIEELSDSVATATDIGAGEIIEEDDLPF